MDQLEIKYTSTVNKLLSNNDLLESIKQNKLRPQSIQLACTDKCNLKCVFCSVDNRNGNELTREQTKKTLEDFRKLGAKTVELTGGGDPTMYKYINETIELANELGYETGMISNGAMIVRNIKQENLDRLTWLRISLNSLDYLSDINVPTIKGTLGFSYVWNERSSILKLNKIVEYVEKYGADFCRIVPNCLDIETKEKYIKEIGPIIDEYEKLFFQSKEHKVPGQCWIGYIKPFVNSDGNVYMCSANPLIDRKFNPHWKIGSIDDIEGIYNNIKAFDTSKCIEGKCFFKDQNDIIRDILDGKQVNKPDIIPEHKFFI